jgi:hypothetical protein
MLDTNLMGLTMRIMTHNPGQTPSQVQQLDGWRTTASLLLTGIIIFFPQDIIDKVSCLIPLNRLNTDLNNLVTPSRKPDHRWPQPAVDTLSAGKSQRLLHSGQLNSAAACGGVVGGVLRAALYTKSGLGWRASRLRKGGGGIGREAWDRWGKDG